MDKTTPSADATSREYVLTAGERVETDSTGSRHRISEGDVKRSCLLTRILPTRTCDVAKDAPSSRSLQETTVKPGFHYPS